MAAAFDYTDPANWPVGPLNGHKVRITAPTSEFVDQVFEVVSDMGKYFPIIGILPPGHESPLAFFYSEFEEVTE